MAMKQKNLYNLRCLLCDKSFQSRKQDAIYCKRCYFAMNGSYKGCNDNEVKKLTMSNIAKIVEQAKELGMSYGEYQAYLRENQGGK